MGGALKSGLQQLVTVLWGLQYIWAHLLSVHFSVPDGFNLVCTDCPFWFQHV